MRGIAKKIPLTENQYDVLSQIVTSRTHGLAHIERAQIILLSADELKFKILSFVSYFNQTMARAFKWTYKGKVLKA